jgi:putative flippase GtrA
MRQFLRFCVAGGMGTLTHLVIFFLGADVAGLHEIPVSIGCFLIAATQNYLVNYHWSFREVTSGERVSLKKWALYIGSSLVGLAVNLTVMEMALTFFVLPYKTIAQAVGTIAGMMINFAASKFIVFRRKHKK